MADWVIQLTVATILGSFIAIISYFLKNFKAQLDKNVEQLQTEVSEQALQFQKYQLEAADKFVQKDDFIRATAQMERKLDRIYDELMKMNKSEGKA